MQFRTLRTDGGPILALPRLELTPIDTGRTCHDIEHILLYGVLL
jgi:hypothetical protein